MIEKILNAQPKILMISNNVTLKFCADALCALGARPSMTYFNEEMEEIAASYDGVILNMGTPCAEKNRACLLAASAANAKNIPLLLDIQGFCLSFARQTLTQELLLRNRFAIIKGNKEEIASLCSFYYCHEDKEAERIKELAKITGSVILCSGKEDIVSDGEKTALLKNGCYELALISGTGCILGALCGALLGSGYNAFDAAFYGAGLLGLCGEKAYAKMSENKLGIGSMSVFLLDEIYLASEKLLEKIDFSYI